VIARVADGGGELALPRQFRIASRTAASSSISGAAFSRRTAPLGGQPPCVVLDIVQRGDAFQQVFGLGERVA
jgi:hypothetical protein